ncbi:MAG: hypothetical protein RDV48_13780 [Candidatus Eremiobacteraeota bacterium]|nr:hypothetical protein [Candidatus Eremiobacteraeota bacterium]
MMDRQSLSHYRDWNESRLIESVFSAGTRSLEEKWRDFKDLTAFCLMLKGGQSPAQQLLKAKELEHYYEMMKLFEEKRKTLKSIQF